MTETLNVLSVQDEDALHLMPECEPIVCSIRFANMVVGTLALSPSPNDAEDAHRLVPLVARELGGALRMSALVEETQRQASIDVLTGLMNRRAFLPAIRGEVARSRRYGLRLSVLLLDIDHFKVINDRFGHAAGDLVLASVGRLLAQTQRNTDFSARWGGEEFVIALTCTDVDGGRVAAERTRAAVEGLLLDNGSGVRIPVTASVGLASLLPDEDVEQLMNSADHAMYAAKYGGRNRVGVDEPGSAPAVLGDPTPRALSTPAPAQAAPKQLSS